MSWWEIFKKGDRIVNKANGKKGAVTKERANERYVDVKYDDGTVDTIHTGSLKKQ